VVLLRDASGSSLAYALPSLFSKNKAGRGNSNSDTLASLVLQDQVDGHRKTNNICFSKGKYSSSRD
jgi:hypothetical protein